MLYHSRKKLKNNIVIKLDLTKYRYTTLSAAINLVKDHEHVDYVMADINCRLKIVFKDNSSKFFGTIDELRDLINSD